jgi:hypothetical protein
MINKILIGVIVISLAGVLVGLGLAFFPDLESEGQIAGDIFLTIGQASGILLLLKNGTILTTIYWKIICLLFCLAIVGFMFKIMHWKFADIILLTSLISIAITYLIRFIFKNKKSILDILKALGIVVSFISTPIILLHWLSSDVVYFGKALLWMAILYYLFLSLRQKAVNDSI